MAYPLSLSRRTLFKQWLAVGVAHTCGALGVLQEALAANTLPIQQGILSTKGKVTIDGHPVRIGTVIRPGQTVRTGRGAEAIYVIDRNAFLQREASTVHFHRFQAFMRVITGRILSVLDHGNKRIIVPDITLGIRGTAFHIAVETNRTYLCLCYGDMAITLPPEQKALPLLHSSHHNHAMYLPRRGHGEVQPAQMWDHTDEELRLLEALVGRLPAFMVR